MQTIAESFLNVSRRSLWHVGFSQVWIYSNNVDFLQPFSSWVYSLIHNSKSPSSCPVDYMILQSSKILWNERSASDTYKIATSCTGRLIPYTLITVFIIYLMYIYMLRSKLEYPQIQNLSGRNWNKTKNKLIHFSISLGIERKM